MKVTTWDKEERMLVNRDIFREYDIAADKDPRCGSRIGHAFGTYAQSFAENMLCWAVTAASARREYTALPTQC
jgi:hypothetical protein